MKNDSFRWNWEDSELRVIHCIVLAKYIIILLLHKDIDGTIDVMVRVGTVVAPLNVKAMIMTFAKYILSLLLQLSEVKNRSYDRPHPGIL